MGTSSLGHPCFHGHDSVWGFLRPEGDEVHEVVSPKALNFIPLGNG